MFEKAYGIAIHVITFLFVTVNFFNDHCIKGVDSAVIFIWFFERNFVLFRYNNKKEWKEE